MAEFDGPWSRPAAGSETTPPPTPGLPQPGAPGPARGPSSRTVIWLCVLSIAVTTIAALIWRFPGALAKIDQPNAWYLVGLLALSSSALVRMRGLRLASVVGAVAGWTAVFAVLFAGYAFRGDLRAIGVKLQTALNPEHPVAAAQGTVVIGRSAENSFYVAGQINGQPARFLIDTGATDIVLNQDDAARAGLTPAAQQFSRPSETANGVGYGASGVVKSLVVGSIRLTDVPVQINKAPMSASLLGMTFLQRLESYDVKGDQLTLRGR